LLIPATGINAQVASFIGFENWSALIAIYIRLNRIRLMKIEFKNMVINFQLARFRIKITAHKVPGKPYAGIR
jgi:hypothetical protein